MKDITNEYSFGKQVSLTYEAAVEAITEALKEEGFGVLTEIDMQSTFKKKLNADFRRYAILGACNPTLAHRALSDEIAIGLLLPCNVVVYEEGEGSVIAIADPIAMLGIADNALLKSVAEEARTRLQRALEHVLSRAG